MLPKSERKIPNPFCEGTARQLNKSTKQPNLSSPIYHQRDRIAENHSSQNRLHARLGRSRDGVGQRRREFDLQKGTDIDEEARDAGQGHDGPEGEASEKVDVGENVANLAGKDDERGEEHKGECGVVVQQSPVLVEEPEV